MATTGLRSNSQLFVLRWRERQRREFLINYFPKQKWRLSLRSPRRRRRKMKGSNEGFFYGENERVSAMKKKYSISRRLFTDQL